MINSIVEAISVGRSVKITVSGFKNGKVEQLRAWLSQFRSACDGPCINCNSYTTRDGAERLEMDINIIPEGQRQFLIGTLQSMQGTVFTEVDSR